MLSLASSTPTRTWCCPEDQANGKTHTAIALGLLARGEGRKVAFWSTAELVSELEASANKEGTTQDGLRSSTGATSLSGRSGGTLPTASRRGKAPVPGGVDATSIAPYFHHQHRISPDGVRDLLPTTTWPRAMMDRIVPPRQAHHLRQGVVQGQTRAHARSCRRRKLVPRRRSCVKKSSR